MKFSIKRFAKNVKYLFECSLKEREATNTYNTLLLVEEMIEYGEVKPAEEVLKILSIEQTMDLLLDKKTSFCRFGDADIDLMSGNDCLYQKYDPRLADIMINILKKSNDNYLVGINYHYFHSTKTLNTVNRRFYLMSISKYRKFLLDNCYRDRTYIAAGFNQVYAITTGMDYADYYSKIKRMISKEDIVLVCGDRVFDNIEHNIFDFAHSIEYVTGPSTDAFRVFDDLLEKCRSYSKEKVLAFILGPTSKALVHILSQEGYIAWDIGHLAKDYDFYMKGSNRDGDNIASFFAAD